MNQRDKDLFKHKVVISLSHVSYRCSPFSNCIGLLIGFGGALPQITVTQIQSEAETLATAAVYFKSLMQRYDVLYQQGLYGEAIPIMEEILAISISNRGDKDIDITVFQNHLGALHYLEGNYGEALSYFQQVLATHEAALGSDHLIIATSLNNIASLYQAQENYGEALSRYQQALAIYEAVLGPDHPNVADSLNNIALLY